MAVEPWSKRSPPDDGDGRPSRPKVQAVLRRTFRWMPEREHAHAFAHVGITVPDVETALDWYQAVLGFDHLTGPLAVERNEGHLGDVADELYRETDFESVKLAHLTTANQVTIELFEFDGTTGDATTDPTTPGISHICVIDPDVEGLAHEIEAAGGEQNTSVRKLFPDQDYRLAYCEDPFGNDIEIYSHSSERIFSNQTE
jgi:catechol 2,3-dioxygenase-like lactoylglutathione lyase family enzyme